jgi:uncharacterized protein HemY
MEKVRPDPAVDLARKAVTLCPERGDFWHALGAAQYRAGHWKAALEALQKARQIPPNKRRFNGFFLAMAYWQVGNQQEARRWYEQGVRWLLEDRTAPQKDRRRFQAEAARLLGLPEL